MNNGFSRGISILKDKYALFLLMCMTVSLVSVFLIPLSTNSLLSGADLSQSAYYSPELFSIEQITASLTYIFRFFLISTVLLVMAYITKRMIDIRMFDWRNGRDWKFFIVISAIIPLELYVFQGYTTGDVIQSFFSMVLYTIITVISSALLLPDNANS